MVDRSVPGQLEMFNVEDFKTSTVASGIACGLSLVSTRTKLSPHQKITRKVLEEAAIKLASLEPLNSTQTITQ